MTDSILDGFKSTIGGVVQGAVDRAFEGLQGTWDKLGAAISGGFAQVAGYFESALTGVTESVKGTITSINDFGVDIGVDVSSGFRHIRDLIDGLGESVTNLVADGLSEVRLGISGLVDGLSSALRASLGRIGEGFEGLAVELRDGLGDALERVGGWVLESVRAVALQTAELAGEIFAGFKFLAEYVAPIIADAVMDAAERIWTFIFDEDGLAPEIVERFQAGLAGQREPV